MVRMLLVKGRGWGDNTLWDGVEDGLKQAGVIEEF